MVVEEATMKEKKDVSLRHVLATLAYRASKAVRDVPADFSSFRAAPGSRSAGEILAHLCDLLDWALSTARGQRRWGDSKPQSWKEDTDRFFAAVTAFDEFLSSDEELHAPAGRLFQAGVADALTHVGQIALLRRLAASPVRGESYYEAQIEVGHAGLDQPAPVKEFD
jgi:hypothetical protein